MKCSETFNCGKYSYTLVLKHDNANHESVYPKQRRLLAAEIFGKIRAGNFIARSPAFSILRLG